MEMIKDFDGKKLFLNYCFWFGEEQNSILIDKIEDNVLTGYEIIRKGRNFYINKDNKIEFKKSRKTYKWSLNKAGFMDSWITSKPSNYIREV